MVKIDSELTKALLEPDENLQIGEKAPIKDVAGFPKLDWETEVDIGKDRTADILIKLLYKHKESRKIVIEIENDRKFDVEETLRKIKRQNKFPNIAIIPKESERHAYQFQKSGIPVWFWTATCRWKCRNCNHVTESTDSYPPHHCKNPECNKVGFLSWIQPKNIKFEKAKNNPLLNWNEIGGSSVERPW